MSGETSQFAQSAGTAAVVRGYYGQPVIHGPHWKWLIVGYFFLGGIAGCSAAIGATARLVGGAEGRALARRATIISAAALLPCPVLLILDLRRPARFLNMLRAFRPTSPMSMGTWGLTLFGAATTVLALAEALLMRDVDRDRDQRRPLEAVATISSVVAGASGLFVGGYSGVLLAATAVPLWSKSPKLLGPLSLASSLTAACASIAAVLALDSGSENGHSADVQRLEIAATLAEGTLLVCWVHALGSTGAPLFQGRLWPVVRHGVGGIGIAAPLLLTAIASVSPRPMARAMSLLACAMTLAGGLALRYALVAGGSLSADDPAATFDMTG